MPLSMILISDLGIVSTLWYFFVFHSILQRTTILMGSSPKSDIKIIERGIIYTPNTQMVDGLLSWLDTGTSIKSFMSSNLPSKRNILLKFKAVC
jgi:hypothetical protein